MNATKLTFYGIIFQSCSNILKRFLGILFLSFILASTAEAQHTFCGVPTTVSLIAGQNITSGSVTVNNDENGMLYINIATTDNWLLKATHIAVASSLSGLPQTKTGNAIPGQFPYSNTFDPYVSQYQYIISSGSSGYLPGTELYIAVHAEVVQMINSVIIKGETAWGNGLGFPGKNWSMYFKYTIQECPPPVVVINPGDFRTQTQGGWGAVCHGGNPACYRDSHFAAAFSNGALIGLSSSSLFAKYTSSSAVEAFLPAGGTPNMFTQSYVDPAVTSAGVLAGQVLALSLSVAFDQSDPSFGASPILLKNLKVADTDSVCYGMTVQQVLDTANQILGGVSLMSPSDINGCVDAINNNFDNGTVVGSYLALP